MTLLNVSDGKNLAYKQENKFNWLKKNKKQYILIEQVHPLKLLTLITLKISVFLTNSSKEYKKFLVSFLPNIKMFM